MALLRMLAVSVISTMKVLWPRLSSSVAPTRAKMRSTTPIRADLGRDEAAHLGEDADQGDLADVGALARHVRAGEDDDQAVVRARDATSFGTKAPWGIRASRTGCRPSSIRRTGSAGHLGAAVALTGGEFGQAAQHVDLGQHGAGLDEPRGLGGDAVAEGDEQLVFEVAGAILRSEDLVLVLLQLGGDVAFAVLDRLLADVVGGSCLPAAWAWVISM